MLTKILKKTAMITLIFIASFIVIGNLLHRVIFREKKPDISSFFKPGQKLISKAEGASQTVIKQENGFVYCIAEIGPFAGGPPAHIHTDFDETFQVENGELSVWVNGEIKKVRPGDVLHIPKGTPHKPFNETADTIRITGVVFPEKFAFCLNQVYNVIDSRPGFARSPKMALQMPLFQDCGFDAYLVEGPPVFLQKTMSFVISPLSRLLGYKIFFLNKF
jgi:mannose-6-phosphate isomerase-like protein (cupin superfamily)